MSRPASWDQHYAPDARWPASWDARDSEIVADWLRSAPEEGPIKRDDRDIAAQSADRELGPVAGLESRCRLIRARLMARFLSRRSWLPLGFARLRDYSEERLGLAARTLEEDARVVQALDALPATKAAFLARKINWTHVRLLITVATAKDEEDWLEIARDRTTRELEGLVKVAVRSASDGAAGLNGASSELSRRCAEGEAGEDPSRQYGGEAPATGSDTVCRGTERCGDGGAAAEGDAPSETPLRQRDDGAPGAGTDESSEAARPGADEEDADPMLLWTIRCSREGRRLWRASCEMASRMAGTRLARWQAAELIAAEAISGAPHEAASSSQRDGAPGEAAESWRARSEQYVEAFAEEHGTAEGFAHLDALRPSPDLPARLEALIEDIDHADAHELDRRLRVVGRAMQRIDWQLGTILRRVVDHRLHQQLGFANFKLYVEARLGISARKGWALVRLERTALHRSSELRAAYRRGDISWLAATALLPVISEKYQHEWIERAAQVTLQRLAAEVSWALDRADEPGGVRNQPPPPIDLDVSADAASRVQDEQVQMRARSASASAPDPLGQGFALGALISLRAPVSVIGLLEEAIAGYQGAGEQRWRAFERVMAHSYLVWQSQPRHHDKIFARDGWTCQVPACTSRCHLHDHHLIFLSRGGGDEVWNRVSVCAAHHLHGIHAGIIRACGCAPSAVSWELGCRAGREPLLRTIGDRYLERRGP